MGTVSPFINCLTRNQCARVHDYSLKILSDIGVTNLHYQDPETDGVVPFSIAHVANAAWLAQRLNQFDMLSTPGIAQDISQQTADLHTPLEMAANTPHTMFLNLACAEMTAYYGLPHSGTSGSGPVWGRICWHRAGSG